MGLPLSALAQTSTGSGAGAVALPESVIADDPAVQVVGQAAPSARVQFEVALNLRDRAQLDARIASGDAVSPAELQAEHLPSQAAFDAVRGWLVSQGLAIEPETDVDDRLAIRASGTVAQVGQAFGVRFAEVSSEGQSFVAARSAPTIPGAIAPYVLSINGLQPYQHAIKFNEMQGPTSGSAPHEAADAQGGASPEIVFTGDYYPFGVARAYQGLPYLKQNGAGTRTAILIDTFPHTSDVTLLWKEAGIPQKTSNLEEVKVVSGTLPAPSGEETIDVDESSGVGYGSKVRVYATVTLQFTDLDAGFRRILSDMKNGIQINQVSISLGACEENIARGQINTDESLLQSIAATHATILVATGDHGAPECGPGKGLHASWYSTSPFVTAVGGTHLIAEAQSQTSPVKIKTETGWSGSGGGISQIFVLPAWQKAAKLNFAGRAVPDVAAVGDPSTGVEIYLNGSAREFGGTSVATPIWAGFVSWINQARLAAKEPELGPLNPRIYPLLGTANFRDTLQGCNGGYCAKKGYDLVTGLGSPIMDKLLPTLLAQH